MDSMLGDSLLDPPQSLQKIPPKRYQSPSRCGSPSLEAPEHLLFGFPGAKRDSAYGKTYGMTRLDTEKVLFNISLYVPLVTIAAQQLS